MLQLLLMLPHGSEWLLVIVVIAGVIIWVKTLVEILNAKFSDNTSKVMWFIVVFFLGIFGALIYVLFRRYKTNIL